MSHESSSSLSYDTGRPVWKKPNSPKDLGVIVTLVEVAALSLTTHDGKVFSTDDLIREAAEIGHRRIAKRDFEIVAPYLSFLKKVRGGWRLS
jgi:hypothetical protein